jgi:hypothetical protein
MALFINKLTGGFSASAKVVDGTLILSLPDAIAPVVWRMELGHAKSSAIEVREQDNGTFMLTLKTPKGDINDIAPYDSRAKAVTALVAISRAMEHAHGEIHPANAPGTAEAPARRAKGESRSGSVLTGVAGLVLVGILIVVMMRMFPMPAGIDPAAGNMASGPSAASGFMNPAPAGEPVSADDFLSRQ